MGLLTACLALALAQAASAAGAWEKPGFPTFADMGGKPYTVSYDKRALQIEGEPALFVSGAIHPPRGTPEMWSGWFEHAKANNLNMVQVYIFWHSALSCHITISITVLIVVHRSADSDLRHVHAASR